jgi:ubiquitin-conjugating enzyme E2 variant
MQKTHEAASRAWWMMVLEAGAVTAFGALTAVLVERLVRGVSAWREVPIVVAAGVAGYALADVASGVTHWFCDTFFEEDTPGIGRVLIFPFREHHRDPAGMTRHGFLELTGNSCLALLPVLGLGLRYRTHPAADAALVAFALALFATNLFHMWAHSERVPAAVAWLQRRRLILSPDVHEVHHRPGNRGAHAVTNGWTNPLLDRILS